MPAVSPFLGARACSVPPPLSDKLMYGEWSELPRVREPRRGTNGPRPTQSLKCHVGSRGRARGCRRLTTSEPRVFSAQCAPPGSQSSWEVGMLTVSISQMEILMRRQVSGSPEGDEPWPGLWLLLDGCGGRVAAAARVAPRQRGGWDRAGLEHTEAGDAAYRSSCPLCQHGLRTQQAWQRNPLLPLPVAQTVPCDTFTTAAALTLGLSPRPHQGAALPLG